MPVKITEIGSNEPPPTGMIKLKHAVYQVFAQQMTWFPVQVHQLLPDGSDEVWVYVTPEAHWEYEHPTRFDNRTRGKRVRVESNSKTVSNGVQPQPKPPVKKSSAEITAAIEVLKAQVTAADNNQVKIYNAICDCMATTGKSAPEISLALGNSTWWAQVQIRHVMELTPEALSALHEGRIRSKVGKMLSKMEDADQLSCLSDLLQSGLTGTDANDFVWKRLELLGKNTRGVSWRRGPWPARKVLSFAF